MRKIYEGTSTRKSSNGNIHIDLGLGLTYLISDQIGLEAILNFTGINFGFQIYLPPSK